MLRTWLLIFAILFSTIGGYSQFSDTVSFNRKLLNKVIAGECIAGTAAIAALYSFWYADYPHSSFHFFNDNREWLQMDKIGHATTAYNMGRIGYALLRWPGVEKKKALWYGGSTGLMFLTAIEIMDGFSAEWGASWGDVTANTLGTALFIGQQYFWDEQRIQLKWSFHKSPYAQYVPDLLGKNMQSLIKDYNGQTYWLSVNVSSFLPKGARFPCFLNVALGYSGEGMTGGYANRTETDGRPIPFFDRTRQFFLSLDVDLSRVKTRYKTINTLFNIVGVVKFPFPALEYNSSGNWKMHGFYF